MNDEAKVTDEIETTVEPAAGVPVRRSYRVTVEGGIFKNGKLYEQGEIVELDEVTAGRFMEIGEVENAE
jgi:hypothetical protein